MKQTILTTFLFFSTGSTVLAQVGIGILTPKAGLDITSDQGLLIPRMTDHTTLIPVDGTLDTNENGLQVYNETTNTIMLWDGSQWVSLNYNFQYESGEQVYNGNSNGYNPVPITGGSANEWGDIFTFTIPSAGTWRLTYPVIVESLTGAIISAAIKRENGIIVPNSPLVINHVSTGHGWSASTGITEVVTTGEEIFTLVAKGTLAVSGSIYSHSHASEHGVTKVSWGKVAGFLPATEEQYFTEVSYTATPFSLLGSYTAQLLPYNSVDESVGGAGSWFDTSTHRFTPQKAGWWSVAASFDVYRGINEAGSIRILKNGVGVSQAGGLSVLNITTTKEVYLNGTTDYIEVINYGSVAVLRDQAPHTSFFQARWMGE